MCALPLLNAPWLTLVELGIPRWLRNLERLSGQEAVLGQPIGLESCFWL